MSVSQNSVAQKSAQIKPQSATLETRKSPTSLPHTVRKAEQMSSAWWVGHTFRSEAHFQAWLVTNSYRKMMDLKYAHGRRRGDFTNHCLEPISELEISLEENAQPKAKALEVELSELDGQVAASTWYGGQRLEAWGDTDDKARAMLCEKVRAAKENASKCGG